MEFQFNPTVDSLESVPQDFRGLYAETEGGKFALRTDDDFVKSTVSAVTGLSKALKVARAEAQGWKGKSVDLSALQEFGDTPEAILEGFNNALSEATKGKKTQEDFQRQISKIKEELGAAHVAELQKHQAKVDAYKGQLYTHLVTSEAHAALGAAGVVDPKLVMPFIKEQVRVTEENDKFEVIVTDAAGDPRYSGVTGAPMGVKELVDEMKSNEQYAPLFKSEQKSGGGTRAESQRRIVRGDDASDLSPKDKIALGLEKGLAS